MVAEFIPHRRPMMVADVPVCQRPKLWVLALSLILLIPRPSLAMIEGGEGNKPLRDPGWPDGAAAVFNWQTRVAWWVDPPFGGGRWHAECKGNAEVLNKVLIAFAKIDAPVKRLIVHDGIGYSFWLDPNAERRADRTTKIDWSFTVWQPASWKMQRELPPSISAVGGNATTEPPPPVIEIYAASVRWAEVQIPDGIEVIDQRLEAHGYSKEDGRVIEGTIVDAHTGKPVRASVRVEHIVPKSSGGYDYSVERSIETNQQGHWHFTEFSDQWSRIVAEADGYAPRVIQYVRYDRQPGWEEANTSLNKAAELSGRVVDSEGQPLAGVRIHIRDLTDTTQNSYRTPQDPVAMTQADGSFTVTQLPVGSARLTGHLQGFVGPGLGVETELPADSVELVLAKAASIRISVEFEQPRGGAGYIVEMIPEGGEKIGSWSGTSNLDAADQVHFKNVPAGRYQVSGRPNPGRSSQRTKPKLVILKGGSDLQVTLQAVAQ